MNILSLQRHMATKYLNDKLSGKPILDSIVSFINIEFSRSINQLIKDDLTVTDNTDSKSK